MSRRASVALLVVGCLLFAISISAVVLGGRLAGSTWRATPAPASPGTAASARPSSEDHAKPFDRVVIVVFENRSLGSVLGSRSAPYFNSLATTYATATGYSGVARPSLPNYLALTGGSTFGVDSNCTDCWIAEPSIANRLEAAGLEWKAYQDGMPEPCFVGSAYPYAQKHNPFIYYTRIREDAARCAHIVPLTAMAADFASPSTAPAYSFVTPDMCHDAHDCDMAEADRWLSAFARSLMDSPGFSSGRSLLVVTFDEGESDSQRVFTVFAGPSVKPGYRSAAAYNHYSLLRTIEDNFGLAPLSDSDASARPMSEFFRTP